MRQLDINNKTNFFQENVYTMTHDAQSNMIKDNMDFKNKTVNDISKIFNRKNPKNVAFDISNFSARKNTGISISRMKNGKLVEVPVNLSQLELLNIYLQSKNSENKTNLESMGWNKKKLIELENYLDPKVIKLGEYMMNTLKELHPIYNETHIKLYGTSLGYKENYWPSKKDGVRMQELINERGDLNVASIVPGRIKSTSENNLPLEIRNAYSEFMSYFNEMNRWRNMQPVVKGLNVIFNDVNVRKNIEHFHGKAYLDNIDKMIQSFAGKNNSRTQTAFDKTLMTLSSNKLALSPSVGFKQTISSMMFLSEMNGFNILQSPLSFTQMATGTYKGKVDISESTIWRNRDFRRVFVGLPVVESGTASFANESIFSVNMKKFSDKTQTSYFRKIADIYEYSFKGNISNVKDVFGRAGDKVGIGFFGQAFADQRFNYYKKEGKSDVEAKRLALRDFSIHARNTQQNDLWMEASNFHKEAGTLGKIFSMFTTSMDAVRQRSVMDMKELFNGKDVVKNIKRLTIQQGIMQGTFAIANNGFYFPNEDADPLNTTLYITNNFTQGMPVVTQFGDVLEYFLKNDKLKASDVFSSEIVRLAGGYNDIKRIEENKEKLLEKMYGYGDGRYTFDDIIKLYDYNKQIEEYEWDVISAISSFTLPAGNFKNVERIKDGVLGTFMQDDKLERLQKEIDALNIKFENGEKVDVNELVGKSYLQLLTGMTSPYYEGRDFEDWFRGNFGLEGASTEEQREIKSLIKKNLEKKLEIKNDVLELLNKYNIAGNKDELVDMISSGKFTQEHKNKIFEPIDKKFFEDNKITLDKKNNKILINGEPADLQKIYNTLPSLQWDILSVKLANNTEQFGKIMTNDYQPDYEMSDEDVEQFILLNYFSKNIKEYKNED
jgi:hypothetical protein